MPQLINKGEYFVTFDLKSGYHHGDIHPTGCASQEVLVIKVNFTVLSYGFVSACYIFTELMRPLVRCGDHWILDAQSTLMMASSVQSPTRWPS